jgi:hypothetical protein
MRIIIETIPHAQHPYPTCGDWRRDADGTLRINVSQEIGDKNALLVALHELIEVTLCENRGITCERVDAFDKAFEETRPEGDNSEPGDHPSAPYRREHFFATSIERLMCAEMGIDWAAYEAEINKLP